MKTFYLIIILIISIPMNAQQSNTNYMPYHKIPEYPQNYSPGNIISRMIDGLGYRYYWATEGLTERDLNYKPSEEARNTLETVAHIYGLSQAILNSALKIPNKYNAETASLTFTKLRLMTLKNLQEASESFRDKTEKDIQTHKVVFERGEQKSEFPFWNLINGQISDAIYHTGQIVSFRRITGHPIHTGVNVFMGKTRE